jgi:DNA polymerase II large subunit
MKTIAKLLVAVAAIAGLSYFSFVVPLGDKTFYEHVVGISETHEARRLEEELEKKVHKTADGVSKEIEHRAGELVEARDRIVKDAKEKVLAGGETGAKDIAVKDVADQPSEADRQALNQLLRKKNAKTD